jgi:hypothetical protein
MLKELLDESNTAKYSVAQNQHTLNIPHIDFPPRWEKVNYDPKK